MYFSDGCAAPYKNKYNFANSLAHEDDFSIKAEWNFFATGHGKGACDGIGGTVKRHVYKASLQRVNRETINSAKAFKKWAETAFKKIDFVYCSKREHNCREKKLQARYSHAKTITHTRNNHYYAPLSSNEIMCKFYSDDVNNVIEKF